MWKTNIAVSVDCNTVFNVRKLSYANVLSVRILVSSIHFLLHVCLCHFCILVFVISSSNFVWMHISSVVIFWKRSILVILQLKERDYHVLVHYKGHRHFNFTVLYYIRSKRLSCYCNTQYNIHCFWYLIATLNRFMFSNQEVAYKCSFHSQGNRMMKWWISYKTLS